MKRLRVYVDTSVLGGYYDVEFAEETKPLIDAARNGRLILVVSDLTLAELEEAPDEVRAILESIPPENVEVVETGEEAVILQRAYLNAGVVSERYAGDALHIAIATVCKVDVVVSWNYRHIVNFSCIRAFNAVNLREGYQAVEIRAPMEVSGYED